MSVINVATDFSRFLGGRYRADGPFSGEEFRDKLLVPRLAQAEREKGKLHVIFDGVAGMPSSFLEEAFGGLLRVTRRTAQEIESLLDLKAKDPELFPYIAMVHKFIAEQDLRTV